MTHAHTHNIHHAFVPQVEQVRIRHGKLGTPQAHHDKGEAASKLDIYRGKKAIRGMKRRYEARGNHFGNRIGMAKKRSSRKPKK